MSTPSVPNEWNPFKSEGPIARPFRKKERHEGEFFDDMFAEMEEEKKPPTPAAPGSQEEVNARQAARLEEEQRARLRTGRRATVLTSPFGVRESAFTRRRTLLGE